MMTMTARMHMEVVAMLVVESSNNGDNNGDNACGSKVNGDSSSGRGCVNSNDSHHHHHYHGHYRCNYQIF